MNVVRGIFEFGDVERVDAGANRLGAFVLYSLSAVHQVRLHVRVCTGTATYHNHSTSQ